MTIFTAKEACMNHFFISIGSNFQSETTIPKAITMMKKEFNAFFYTSSVIHSTAIDKKGHECPDIPPYDNVVGFGLTHRSLDEMIVLLKSVESKLGRIRSETHDKIVHLDLDLVEWNDEILRTWEVEQHFYIVCKKNLLEKIQTIFSINDCSKFDL